MKELIAKIRAVKGQKQKCQLVAQAYGELFEYVENLEAQVSNAGTESNIAVFDHSLDELEGFADELSGLLIPPEMKKFRENMERDYQETLEIWKFYELLNPDGRTYTADYAEFKDKKFTIPTAEEVLAKLKPEHLKVYQKMEKEGLEPKLQITPIAYSIRKLGKQIDARKKELEINTIDTYVWEDIKDEELQYAPTQMEAIKGGKKINITGGKTKSQWIIENGGFLIDIVPTKEAIEPDLAIQKDKNGNINYNAVQAEKYLAKAKHEGLTPMSYESYLLAQMRALKAGKPLEDWNKSQTYSLLLDSNFENSQYIACGRWDDGDVNLDGDVAAYQVADLRLRGSVRVL